MNISHGWEWERYQSHISEASTLGVSLCHRMPYMYNWRCMHVYIWSYLYWGYLESLWWPSSYSTVWGDNHVLGIYLAWDIGYEQMIPCPLSPFERGAIVFVDHLLISVVLASHPLEWVAGYMHWFISVSQSYIIS